MTKNKLKPETSLAGDRSKSLVEVLGQTEKVEDLIAECAGELSVVNTAFKAQLQSQTSLPALEAAVAQNKAVEGKVEEASNAMSAVNVSLKDEVRDRAMLDHRFAASVEQEGAARHAALHDPLTGLPNRVLFNDRLEHGLSQAKRHGWKLAVMFLDLDNFKNINDSFGHDAGDAVLNVIAQRFTENTRAGDTVSRHGGDEFLYLAMEMDDEDDIELVAEKIIKTVLAPCDVAFQDSSVSVAVGASIGIALFPKDGTSADMLIKSADEAMYRAKKAKSGFAFAS